jgi:hypothetical protein
MDLAIRLLGNEVRGGLGNESIAARSADERQADGRAI